MNISKALFQAKYEYEQNGMKNAAKLKEIVLSILNTVDSFKIDYVSLADPLTLNEYSEHIEENGGILSIAVRLGKIRLIDNILLGCNL